MESNGFDRENGLSPEAIEIAETVSGLLRPDSTSQDKLDSDDYNEEIESIDEYRQRPPKQSGSSRAIIVSIGVSSVLRRQAHTDYIHDDALGRTVAQSSTDSC